jgi:hypothetical protein
LPRFLGCVLSQWWQCLGAPSSVLLISFRLLFNVFAFQISWWFNFLYRTYVPWKCSLSHDYWLAGTTSDSATVHVTPRTMGWDMVWPCRHVQMAAVCHCAGPTARLVFSRGSTIHSPPVCNVTTPQHSSLVGWRVETSSKEWAQLDVAWVWALVDYHWASPTVCLVSLRSVASYLPLAVIVSVTVIQRLSLTGHRVMW